MAPLTLEGDTLGQRHQHYNNLIQEAVISKNFELTKINYDANDIENLLKIDVACKTKNVEYIIDVLKCSDMLYVSRAVKQSTWLINDPQYAHIIEPQYLFTQLFPHMNTKAVNKLLLNIRLNLKDQKRVEAFYEYFKGKSDESHKWLQNCSDDFIESALKSGCRIPPDLFKRLCKRSFNFAKYYDSVGDGCYPHILQQVSFLVKNHTEEYFKLVDDAKYCNPVFKKKTTQIIMTKYPNRVLDNFHKYCDNVDLSVVAKHLKKIGIKEFLLKHMKNEKLRYFFNDHDNLKHFIKNLPKEERFQFVKNIYIDKTVTPEQDFVLCSASTEYYRCAPKCGFSSNELNAGTSYQMYQYLPFNVAFVELKKAIRLESSPTERNSILSVLITCAKKNPQDVNSLLQFYHDKHINEPFKFKIQFVNNLLTQTAVHKFDAETWNILNQLFHSMEVYTESKNNVQTCLKYIVLYQILHNGEIPDIIKKKIEFDTFKKSQPKLNEVEKNKLFSYLWNSVTTKIENIKIEDSEHLDTAIETLKNGFKLLVDWKKPLTDYPILLNKLKELIQIKKDRGWKADFSAFYTLNKTWRKHMFECSLVIHPSEEACVNALKHGPRLLSVQNEQVTALQVEDSVPLQRLLTKLRIYWSHSLADEWTGAYSRKLTNLTELKAAIKGLFMLLPQTKLIEIAKKHVPEDNKIKWSEADPLEIGLRKNIAKTLHIARPQPPLDSVLWYAKGDYLQYAVPSLNAITYNLSKVQCRENISKLLEAPVSLQKFGLQLAFNKLNNEEQRDIFHTIWKTTKNSSIRTILFKQTHNLLCKGNDPVITENMWKLLSMFMDNLSTEENKEIYQTLSQVPSKTEIPCNIKAEYFMKSYLFLKSLPAKSNCQTFINRLIEFAPTIVDKLSSDFVINNLLTPVNELLKNPRNDLIPVMSAYVLSSQSEEVQLERYKTVLAPALHNAFNSWDETHESDYHVKDNFITLVQTLTWEFRKLATLKKGIIPIKLFEAIKSDMEQKLPVEENYVFYTCWKLTTEYVKLVNEHKSILNDPKLENVTESMFGHRWMTDEADNVWQELHFKLSPALASVIVKHLKEDVESYFPSIYCVFECALNKMFSNLVLHKNIMLLETLRCMLVDEDFIPCYLLVCSSTPRYGENDEKEKRIAIRKMLASHPSKEVKIHYHKVFGNSLDI